MRKIVSIVLASFLLLVGCQSVDTTDNDMDSEIVTRSTFRATVLENVDSLLVEPLEGEQELKSADQIIVHTSEALLLDREGNEIKRAQITPRMIIEIEYDGVIAESYPAQIVTCYVIQVVEEVT